MDVTHSENQRGKPTKKKMFMVFNPENNKLQSFQLKFELKEEAHSLPTCKFKRIYAEISDF